MTHLHHDHAGALASFPRATFSIQSREMAYAAGPAMRHSHCRGAFEVEDTVEFVRALYAGRVQPIEGDGQIAPGISVHLVGGHSPGIQAVRIETARGPVVLASDCAHFYETVVEGNPFPVLVHVPTYLDGFFRLFELTDDPNMVIPGHDERVLKLFPTHLTLPDAVLLSDGPIDSTPFQNLS